MPTPESSHGYDRQLKEGRGGARPKERILLEKGQAHRLGSQSLGYTLPIRAQPKTVYVTRLHRESYMKYSVVARTLQKLLLGHLCEIEQHIVRMSQSVRNFKSARNKSRSGLQAFKIILSPGARFSA